MRFAIKTAPQNTAFDAMLEVWRAADELRQARCEPKPVQQPHPPIVIGGTGPNRTLRSVARFADHWNHPRDSVDGWKRSLEVLSQRCAEVDRDLAAITASTHVRGDWANPGALVDECAAWAAAS